MRREPAAPALFRSAEGRRRVRLAFLLSLATTTGWWAVSTWLPSYTEELAKAQGEAAGVWGPRMALIYTAGGVLAYMTSGFIADAIGRRKFLFMTYVGCLAVTWPTYLLSWGIRFFMLIAFVNGMFTLGFAYAWMAIYPVELFTASVRSSAASVVFNGARVIAWVFPIIAGTLVAKFGGIANAALIISSIYLMGLVVPWYPPGDCGKTIAGLGAQRARLMDDDHVRVDEWEDVVASLNFPFAAASFFVPNWHAWGDLALDQPAEHLPCAVGDVLQKKISVLQPSIASNLEDKSPLTERAAIDLEQRGAGQHR